MSREGGHLPPHRARYPAQAWNAKQRGRTGAETAGPSYWRLRPMSALAICGLFVFAVFLPKRASNYSTTTTTTTLRIHNKPNTQDQGRTHPLVSQPVAMADSVFYLYMLQQVLVHTITLAIPVSERNRSGSPATTYSSMTCKDIPVCVETSCSILCFLPIIIVDCKAHLAKRPLREVSGG